MAKPSKPWTVEIRDPTGFENGKIVYTWTVLEAFHHEDDANYYAEDLKQRAKRPIRVRDIRQQ